MKNFKPGRITAFSALALAAGLASPAVRAEQFTIAVIPDTQNYCDTQASPQPAGMQVYQREMQYLADQKTARNIVFVTHVGDVVQHGDLYDGEWQNAQSAMNILAASGIPFGMTPGNHDYDNYSHTTGSRPLAGSVKWNQYFGPSSSYFSGKSWFGGSFTDPASAGVSSYETFTAGGKTFLHISLEMEASDASLNWASGVIAAHPGLPTIVTTHEYLSYQNDAAGKAIRLSDGYMVGEANNQCQAVWDKFISQNDQIFLVICGHNWSSTVNGISNGENLRIDNNAFGHPVYQVLSDYQGNTFDATGTPGTEVGGAGWLRLMTFDTQTRMIHFQTYSSELNEYAGVNGGPTFNLPASMSDFTLPVPDRVFSPWKFGVLSDTQWNGSPDDGQSPGTTPAGIIKQCDQAFIAQGVKFVIAVGDTVDTGSQHNMDVRALYAQDLYNAGIGFFPFRGNHESGWTGSAAEEARLYPQILNGGTNNLTPSDVLTSGWGHDTKIDPDIPGGLPFVLGGNFSYPTNVGGVDLNATYGGLSYSFDYNNVRFVLIDQFENQNPGGNTSSAPLQQPWLAQQLTDSARPQHAIVFDHKNLLGGNHKDNIMGANVGSTDPGDGAGVDFGSLTAANRRPCWPNNRPKMRSSPRWPRTRYTTTSRATTIITMIQSCKVPLSTNHVHQIISASDSSKFYVPSLPVSTNDTPISQDLFKVGYYIYTVDGPRVTVDYYGVDVSTNPAFVVSSSSESIVTNTPVLTGNWQKILTYGYSLNGQEFVVPEGGSYTVVADNTAKAVASGEAGYLGSAAQILAGVNTSIATNNYGKAQSKAVDTGWSPAYLGLASDILTLWGTTGIGNQSDAYALSLTYHPTNVTLAQIQNGSFGLMTRDTNGNWAGAVALNTGGAAQFVLGAYSSSYPLGTYGVDTNANTVWAVVNHQGSFAATVAQLDQTVTLAGPDNGSTATNGVANLTWSVEPGASSYLVTLIAPNGITNYYTVTGTSLSLAGGLVNGDYSWSVTPVNGQGNGPVSEVRSLTVSNTPHAPWKFGVLSDTQCTGSPDDGQSPGTTPAGIIKQCDQAFIAQGVKFVIAVGDTVDTGSQQNMDIRALYAQDLYNAGIGFFPFRGNHESGWTGSAAEEGRIYPQILNGGINNLTPSDVLTSGWGHDTKIDPVAPAGVPFVMAENFSYPTNVGGVNINSTYGGLSYSFDYNNVRFVLMDQFENQNPGGNTSSAPLQQPWLAQQLTDSARPQHAIVFDHKNLLGGNHKDNIMGANVGSTDPGDGAGVDFGSLTSANQSALLAKQQAEDAFISALATNNVHYYISGHDHHHYDSIVQSPLSTNHVHQIISASDSSKFYVPSLPVSTNDTPISQDLFKVGYYIYTVDGPRVTVDYYGVDMTTNSSFVKSSSSESIITSTPVLTGNWQKILTYGYSLNGQEFVVPEGGAYTVVADNTLKAVAQGCSK